MNSGLTDRLRSRRWLTLPAIVVLVFVLLGRLLAHGGEDHGDAGAAAPAATGSTTTGMGAAVTVSKEQQFALGMLTEPAGRRALVQGVGVTGRVVPRTDAVADVVPPVPGRVTGGGLPRLGDRVRRGQVLFRVAQVLQPSERASIRGEQIRAKAELDAAEREVSRYERLEGVIAGKQLVEARIRRDAARASYRAISGQLSGEGGSVAVTAPISGVITEAEIASGEVVDGGKVVYRIADLSRVWVEADLFEGDISRIEGSKQAEIRTSSYPGETFAGTLDKFGSTVNPETRTITALFLVDNPGEKLKLNMSASVALAVGESQPLLAVRRDALVKSGARTVIFIHTDPEHFEVRDVVLGAAEGGDYVEVRSGLKAGERVLTTNVYQLKSLAGL